MYCTHEIGIKGKIKTYTRARAHTERGEVFISICIMEREREKGEKKRDREIDRQTGKQTERAQTKQRSIKNFDNSTFY